MEYAQGSNSTTLATSTQSATMACIATRVADASSIRKWVRDAPQMRPAEGNLCAFLKLPSLHTVCVRRFSLCPKILLSSRCTRRIWPTPTRGFSCINKISKKFAAQGILTRRPVAASPDSNLRIRAVCACPTWIAPLRTPPFLLIASAVTRPRELNIAI
jgi:hypothetical protein